MEIIVGKTAGFCYGAQRAVEGAIKEAQKSEGEIYCLGEILHNKQVIERLAKLGVQCVETLEETKGTTLIRAHGVPKEVYEEAKKMNINLKDYTCPNVLKIHEIAEQFKEQDYFIFLLGSKKHPENIGTLSHCGKYYCVIEKEDDVEDAIKQLKASNKNKALLISQSTFSLERFEKIKEILQNKIDKKTTFVIKNTICKATDVRQKETEELSKVVDTMIIIGGKNSSNTKKLYEIAKRNCENTNLIETAKELEINKNAKRIGIMAGASTPKESIEEVVAYLKK